MGKYLKSKSQKKFVAIGEMGYVMVTLYDYSKCGDITTGRDYSPLLSDDYIECDDCEFFNSYAIAKSIIKTIMPNH